MISILLPNYNHAPYLRQRIESILNQTYKDFELIILDDCSPDNSRDIIEEYRNNPYVSQIVYNEKNSGSTFSQWKKGFHLAEGEYIWIAESDDYADPTFLEKVMQSIKKHNSVYCFVQTTVVDKNNEVVMKQPNILPKESIGLKKFTEEYLLFSTPICNASMAVFKKDALDRGVWDRIIKFRYCGDWLLSGSFNGDENATVSEVKEYLNFFRTHSVNVSNKSEQRGLGILEGYKVSKYIADRLKLKRDKEYSLKWYYKWQEYKLKFSYPLSLNTKILGMFIINQPMVVYYELKRLFSRFIK
ncbi:MAG: glycosyltransferase family 2 protein [Dysgonomonas sp.]|nr:glycosyltransferase family 2 protein [Dysgonomonas sp.]